MKTTLRLLLLLALPLATLHAKPTPPDHWVGTWATADLDRANTGKGGLPATDTTLRQIVHVSLGGALVRVELSNEFGTEPLTVGAAHLALAGAGPASPDIEVTTANTLTFGGHATVIIPPGAEVVSDPVSLKLPAQGDLAISLFLPAQPMTHLTVHNSAYQTNYIAAGNVVGEKTLTDATKVASWFFLKSVDVKVSADCAAVVAFGDSITDGTASTPNTNQRWPDFLARRLLADKKTADIGVLNVGIGGNRVLHDGTGPSSLARFDRDVLAQAGVKYLIILESINDIGGAYNPTRPHDVVSSDDLIAGLTQLAERAHMHGIKVFGATLTPYVGAGYSSPEGEVVRSAVNQFIRTSKVFDGVIDFDGATRDPANPAAFNPAFDHGDHLHPSDAGLKAMGDAIDLSLFK
jgi:lysophospholipase L1-like esterase